MNQNLPPSQSGQDSDAGQMGSNPYYSQQTNQAAPDLDAGAPILRSDDLQRLNRKALLFLGGIVALLIVAAFLMLSSAGKKDTEVVKQREEKPSVPELNVGPPLPPSEPVEIEEVVLPALPVAEAPLLMPPDDLEEELPVPRVPTLQERRMGMGAAEEGGEAQQADPNYLAMLAAQNGMNPQKAPAAKPTVATSAQFLHRPDALLVRGTYIRCVLETHIVTDIPGFTSCIVTEPVYSINGRRLLLPKGSKISGQYDTNASGPRVAVIWDRITTPNGIDLIMASPGVDNLGGAGHPGHFNNHWPSRISSALLISLLADGFKYAAAEHGPQSATVAEGNIVLTQPYESATARSMERMANQALERSLNRPATVTINQGTVVNVYVSKDVDFSGVVRN